MVHRHRTPSAFPVTTVDNLLLSCASLQQTTCLSWEVRHVCRTLGGRLPLLIIPLNPDDHPLLNIPRRRMTPSHTHLSDDYISWTPSTLHLGCGHSARAPTSQDEKTQCRYGEAEILMFDDDEHSHLPWRGDGDSHSMDDIVHTGSRPQCCAGDDFSRRPTDDMQPVAHSSIFRGCIPIDLLLILVQACGGVLD